MSVALAYRRIGEGHSANGEERNMQNMCYRIGPQDKTIPLARSRQRANGI